MEERLHQLINSKPSEKLKLDVTVHICSERIKNN